MFGGQVDVFHEEDRALLRSNSSASLFLYTQEQVAILATCSLSILRYRRERVKSRGQGVGPSLCSAAGAVLLRCFDVVPLRLATFLSGFQTIALAVCFDNVHTVCEPV